MNMRPTWRKSLSTPFQNNRKSLDPSNSLYRKTKFNYGLRFLKLGHSINKYGRSNAEKDGIIERLQENGQKCVIVEDIFLFLNATVSKYVY